MKKLLTSVLILALLCSLFGCSEKYEPVESTEEEARVVMTLTAGGTRYDIKYELYRALFLANRDTVDGGDATVWSGENKDEYIARINTIIVDRASEIYSAIHLAESLGFKAYGTSTEDAIEQAVIGAVEGDGIQPGHESYEAYLESLRSVGLNYSVATLMMRYSLAMEYINEYYVGELDVLGASSAEFEYTREDVRAYYDSADCARVLQAYFAKGVRTREYVESFREELIAIGDVYGMAAYILGNTTATATDVLIDDEVSGILVGRDSAESGFKGFTEAVLALEEGELSDIIEVSGTDADGYYLIYRLDKSEDHFELCYDAIVSSYLDNVIGKALGTVAEEMVSSAKTKADYADIVHSEIKMD